MKKSAVVFMLCFVATLTACGKTEIENQVKQDTETSKKMAGDVSKVPRVSLKPSSANESASKNEASTPAPATNGQKGGK